MQAKVRGMGSFARRVWPGLAVLAAFALFTPPSGSVRFSSAAPGPSLKAASRIRDASPAGAVKASARNKLVEDYLHMPLIFEANQGQTNPRVKFISRGEGYALFLTDRGAVLELREPAPTLSKRPEDRSSGISQPAAMQAAVLQLALAGSRRAARPAGVGELPGKSNYFIGNVPSQWHTNIPQYSRVDYEQVYPGVNLVYYGSQGRLEYDFDLGPGVNPSIISLSVNGLSGSRRSVSQAGHSALRVNSQGDLTMRTAAGTVSFAKPIAYQMVRNASGAAQKRLVNARYVVKNADERGKALVGFDVTGYNRNLPLIIDPTLTYSTYIGGSLLDRGQSVALDSSGNAYVTGNTLSVDFPVTAGVFQSKCDSGGACLGNVFVMELTPSTSTLVYSTYLGGNSDDTGFGIAVDAKGNAFVAGEATSTNFPFTLGAYQTACGGPSTGCEDAFVSQIGPGGATLVYSTYLGGNGADEANAITLDSADDVYVGGLTVSTNFPTSTGAYQTKCGTDGNCNNGISDGFFTKLNLTQPGTSALLYSTYLGGSGADFVEAVAVDSSGNVYLTGETKSTDFPTTTGAYETQCLLDTNKSCEGDAFATKLNPAATGSAALVASTRLGGVAEEAGNGIAVDSSLNVYLTGFTASSNFPVTPGAFQGTFQGGPQDAFVTKFNPGLTALIFSTYLGGENYDLATGIALGANNTIYVVGESNSTKFPLTPDALYSSLNQGTNTLCNGSPCRDVTVTEFDSSGTALLFSTYLGGGSEDEGNGIALDSSGNAYVAGFTQSVNPNPFPTANPTSAACVGACGPAGPSSPGDAFLSELGGITAPYALFSPTSVSFPNPQNEGSQSAPQQITLTNSGNASLSISSVVLGGTNQTDFTENDNCVSSSPLAPGANCTLNVTFAPTAAGPLNATLTVTDAASNSPTTINVSGTGVPASMTISPTSLNFPTQAPNTTSPPQTVTVTNTGTGTIHFSSVAITPSPIFAFATGTTCAPSTQLTTNQQCVMNVTFSPTSSAPQNGTIMLTDDGPKSPQTVTLTGNAPAAGVTFKPTSLAFGNVAAGQSSSPQTVTITNSGNLTLTVAGVSVTGTNPGDFSASASGCSSVAPNAQCTVSVTFKPAAPGARSASLSVADNAPGSPQSVPLSGTGTGPGASLSPASGLSFASQVVNTASSPQTVTLTNNGTATLTITGISVTGANASDFSQTNTCGSSVAANANCSISVTFKPAAAGNRTATLSVADNAAGSPQTVPLTGAGGDFIITATTTSESVSPGSNATYNTLSLTSQGGFSQPVNLTCTGFPAASTCAVQPQSATPNANGSATPLTVTVRTTAPSLAPPISHVPPPPSDSGGWVWIFGILGFLTLGTLFAQRRTRRAAWILAPIMLWILMASACGSNSSGGGGGGGSSGTPAGTYTLKVTGTAGSLSNSVSLTLTVN